MRTCRIMVCSDDWFWHGIGRGFRVHFIWEIQNWQVEWEKQASEHTLIQILKNMEIKGFFHFKNIVTDYYLRLRLNPEEYFEWFNIPELPSYESYWGYMYSLVKNFSGFKISFMVFRAPQYFKNISNKLFWAKLVVFLGLYCGQWSPFTIFAPESHFNSIFVSCSLVKSLAMVKWRTVQVKAHGSLSVTWVLHSVKTNGVIDVGALIQLECSFWLLYQRSIWLFLGPVIQCFLQVALEYLQEAMRVGVIMDTAAIAFTPAENHEIKLPISFIY